MQIEENIRFLHFGGLVKQKSLSIIDEITHCENNLRDLERIRKNHKEINK